MSHPGEAAARDDVREFFGRYARAADALDTAGLEACFAESFLSLDPAACTVVPRAALLAALPRRGQMFAAIGADGLQLTALAETPLDERHTMVRTTWTARFPGGPPAAGPLVLPADFLLRRDGGSWRIVVYLNHADVAAEIGRRLASGPA